MMVIWFFCGSLIVVAEDDSLIIMMIIYILLLIIIILLLYLLLMCNSRERRRLNVNYFLNSNGWQALRTCGSPSGRRVEDIPKIILAAIGQRRNGGAG